MEENYTDFEGFEGYEDYEAYTAEIYVELIRNFSKYTPMLDEDLIGKDCHFENHSKNWKLFLILNFILVFIIPVLVR